MTDQEITNEVVEEVKTFDQLIEEARLPLYKEFATSRKISNVLTFVVLIMSIGGMYFVTGELAWLGWILLGVGLCGMLAFYFLSKKRFENNTRSYLDMVNTTLNNQTFANEKFSDITTTDGKMEIADVAGCGVYTDIFRVASRNIISGKFDGNEFKYAEIAIFRKTGNKKQPQATAFVGKYFDEQNSLAFDGNFVINIAREEPVDVPNALEGKAELYNSGGIAVYGDEGADFRKILGEEFFGQIKNISAENHLLNLAISIWRGHTLVFMSYDDDVIAMPFDKSFNKDAFLSFTKDLENVFKALAYLGK